MALLFMREVPQKGTATYTPQPFMLPWGAKVSAEFIDKVFEICERMGWGPDLADELMGCMAFESGRTFRPDIRNAAGSGATGLIQFMPATARDLGTTTDALARMSAVDQLEYVYRYFTKYQWHRRVKCLEDMYMAILMPKYISSPLGAVLFNDGTRAYTQNRGLDANEDGKITKAEVAAKVRAVYLEGFRPENARKVFYADAA
ncbi:MULTISPECIES: hypothetical protein [unclassified Halomonas]|uniref:hypothetical protein n=1 Tax=unclassified Halomonas TaxID=2609666 RepID=UPI00207679A2|nr:MULTISPECIES: hypothetical protein [unclassified Halomonas]